MIRRILLLLAVFALAAPVLLLRGVPQTGPAPAPAQQAPGTVRGIVNVEGSSDPLPDVQISVGGTVALAQLQGAAVGLQAALDSFGGLVSATAIEGVVQRVLETQGARAGAGSMYTATSGSDGRFVINGIPPGQYAISAQREGYFGRATNGTSPIMAQSNISVVSQQAVDVKLTLVPGAAISGRILGPNGTPLTGANVDVMRVTYQNGLPSLVTAGSKQTDDRGEYRLFRLAPAEYLLSATSRPQLSGVARGNAAGTSEPAPMRTFYPNTTDAGAALPLVLRGGEEMSGLNIQVRTALGSTLAGRVISGLSAAPPPSLDPSGARGRAPLLAARGNNAMITLLPRDKNVLVEPNLGVVGISASMASPNDGAFRIPNIPSGSYDLFASLPDPGGYGPGAPPGQATQGVSFGRIVVDIRGDLAGISVNVHPGMDVKGRVIVDGKPVNANVRISLIPNDAATRVPVYQQVGRFQPMVQQDGSFTIPIVPEGLFRFQVLMGGGFGGARGAAAGQGTGTPPPVALPTSAYVADVRQGGISVYDDGIRVGTQEVVPVDVLINTNGGALQGTVLTASMQPVASGTSVVLVPAAERRQNPALYKLTTTNPQGNFSMAGIPPGQYQLFAIASIPPGAYQNAEFIRRYEARGVTVSIAAGAAASQQLSVIPVEESR